MIGQRKDAHDNVALTVVRFLGIASITGLIVVGVLCYVALQYGGDGSTVAVVAIVGNLASAALASLGSILASTGKGTAQPVEVVNTAEKPAIVSETTPEPVAASEFGHIDVGTALVVLIVALVVLAVLGLI